MPTTNINLDDINKPSDSQQMDNWWEDFQTKTNSNNTKIDTAMAEKITQVALKSSLPTSPTTSNNLYIVYGDTTVNNGQYRWNGTAYVKVSTQLDYPTQAEAETGTENTKVMTPLRTFQSIAKWISNTTVSTLSTSVKTIVGAINELFNNKLDKTGDAKDTTVTFTEATTRENILTTDKMSILIGKIKKFFTDLKAVAFSGLASDVTITDTNSKYTSENVDGALDEIGQQLEQKADKDIIDTLWSGNASISTTNRVITLTNDVDTYDYLEIYLGDSDTTVGSTNSLAMFKIYKYLTNALASVNNSAYYGNSKVTIKYTEGNKKELNIWSNVNITGNMRSIKGVKVGG